MQSNGNVSLKLSLLLFCFAWSFSCHAQQGSLSVMSFNIRYNNPDDGKYSWENRKQIVYHVIRNNKPSVIGFQEALRSQVDDIQNNTRGYGWSGVGRDDGIDLGEFSVIFYDSARFEKKEGSTFWLSSTPDKPGTRSWNAACNRIVTWVRLTDRQSRISFFIFNTHFDHASGYAREESAMLLKNKVAEIAGDEMAFITGDFNDTVGSRCYNLLTGGPGNLRNSSTLSQIRPEGPDYTFAGFPFNPEKGNTIDFIFIKNEGNVKVNRHQVLLYNENGFYPSDHLPVMAEFEIPLNRK